MIRIIKFFILLLGSIWVGVQLYHDPGYLLITRNHWSLETTWSVAIPALMISFLLIHIIWSVLHWFVHIPQTWKAWITKHRLQKAQSKTRQGLIEFSEGHWKEAKKHLINALPDTETPLLNYLTAARAAQEMGDSKLRDDYLREAQQSMPEAKIAVELTQAQLQLANHQWEQALATLRHLQDLSPHHVYVLKLLMHLYEEVKDWPQLITLLPTLKHHHVITEDEFNRLQKHAYLQSMIDLIKQDQPDTLDAFFKKLPKRLMNDSDIIAHYSSYLIKHHEEIKAESLLRLNLKKQFNEQLIIIYGKIKNNRSLIFAEQLLKSNPHSPGLYLCLGQISKTNQLWGKARVYFEDSIRLNPTPAAYAALGELLEQLDKHTDACDAYRQGLKLVLN